MRCRLGEGSYSQFCKHIARGILINRALEFEREIRVQQMTSWYPLKSLHTLVKEENEV